MMFSKPSPQNHALGIALLLSACGQPSGTETGNPVVQRPPYESPTDYNPDDPTPPGCTPLAIDTQPRRGPYWAKAGDTTLVGAEHDAGLRVVDVTDPQAPSLLATLPLVGNVLALVASGNDVAIVIEEPPSLPTDAIPTSTELESVLRLVHVDVSDRSHPTRVGDVTIDGKYWDVRVQDEVLWLMSAGVVPPNACLLPGQGCGGYSWTSLRVNGYRFVAAGFEPLADVELPISERAWASTDGFVTESGSSEDGSHRLSVARIDGDTLAVSEYAGDASPAHGSPVGVIGDKLYVLSDAAGSSTLEVLDVSGAIAESVSQVPDLPAQPRAVTFEPTRVIVGNSDYTRPGAIVTLDDLSQPVVTGLPAGVAQAMPVEVNGEPALLGWGDSDGSSTLTIGLLSTNATGELALVQALHTDLPTQNGSSDDGALYQPNTVRSGDTVAFLYYYYEPTSRRSAIGVLDLSSDPIALANHEAGYGEALLMGDDWIYAPGFSGVTSVSLTEPGAEAALDFADSQLWPADALPAGDRTLSLIGTLGGMQLVVTDATQTEVARLDVPNTARKLLPLGNAVALLADASDGYCESLGVPCDEPSLVVIDPGAPEIIAEWPLPNPTLGFSSSTSTQTNEWLEPVQLGNGNWVLALAQATECLLIAECEQLDIDPVPLSEANIAFGSVVQDCPPDVDPCELPPPPPDPEVYGKRTTLDLYLLDAEAVSDPSSGFRALGTSTLELLDSRFAPLRTSGSTVLVTRLEAKLARGQSWVTNARGVLDTFDTEASAGTNLPNLVNIPGMALGLADDGQVIYTSEARRSKDESATLYRLQMVDGEALVMAKRTLPGRYGDVRIAHDVAYYIEQGADGCTPGAIHAIALDETLTELGVTELTGGDWNYQESDDHQLLLQGPNYDGYALFDVTQAPAVLEEFQPAALTGEFAHIHDGKLWGPGRR